jgi:chemotaxis protein methyltransferase CheR
VRILATDVSGPIVEAARTGLYPASAIRRGMSAGLREKYFTQEGDNWKVRDSIARLVQFRVLNLAEPWPLLPPMDVMFLRNVLIYFEPALRSRILDRAHGVLADHGRLFLGATESTRSLSDRFEQVQVGATICYRKQSHASAGGHASVHHTSARWTTST